MSNKLLRFISPLILGMGISASASVKDLPNHFKDIKYPKFKYSPPSADTIFHRLENNIPAYLVADPSLPLVRVKFLFKEEGARQDSTAVPVMRALDAMLRRGGTQNLTPAQIEDSLAFNAAGIGISIGSQFSVLSLDVMKKDLEATLDLLLEIVNSPRFDSAQIALWQTRAEQALKHRFDKPANISKSLLAAVAYGSHPENWEGVSADLKHVTQAKLAAQLKHHFSPQNLVVSAAGDFDKTEMKKLLQKFISKLPKSQMAPEIASAEAKMRPGIWAVDFDSKQVHIRMAQPFVKRPHPDYYPASLASYILGGGSFDSRLTSAVRTKEGLAYSIYSYTNSSYFGKASAGVAVQTKSASAMRTLFLIQREIERLATEGPTPEELARAKASLINGLPSIFDTPLATADAYAYGYHRGRQPTHFEDYPKKIQAITAQQVKAMIKKYFAYDKMTITLVGPKAAILAPDSLSKTQLDSTKVKFLTTDDLIIRPNKAP